MAKAGVPLWRLNSRSTMPGILPSTATIRSPVASRSSRLSPNTLTATCAVSPLRLSLLRSLIHLGIRLELDVELSAVRTPGVFAQFGAPHLLGDGRNIGQRQNVRA